MLDNFRDGAAHELHIETDEQARQLVEMAEQWRKLDRAGQGEPQRTDFAALDRRGERTRSESAFVALLEQRQHALAELGQLGLGSFPPKQVAAQLALELLDRAGQRGLRDVALLGCLGEIELAHRRQEISDLMHFHSSNPSTP